MLFIPISKRVHTVFIFALFNISVLRKTEPHPSEYNCSTLLNVNPQKDLHCTPHFNENKALSYPQAQCFVIFTESFSNTFHIKYKYISIICKVENILTLYTIIVLKRYRALDTLFYLLKIKL